MKFILAKPVVCLHYKIREIPVIEIPDEISERAKMVI